MFFTLFFFNSMRNHDFRDTDHTSECLFEISRLVNFLFFLLNPETLKVALSKRNTYEILKEYFVVLLSLK